MRFLRVRSAVIFAGAAIVGLAADAPAAAQQRSVGAKVGLSSSDLDGRSAQSTSRLRGFAAGIFVTQALVQELSAQAEIMYMQKGARVPIAHPGNTATVPLRVDYIEIPAMFRLDARILPNVAVYGVAGPSVAIRVRCEFDDRPCAAATGEAQIRALDWSMTGGAGLSVGRGPLVLSMEARLHVGLGTIDASSTGLERTHQAFGLLAGASMRLE
jgi:hypothetical protein